MAAPISHGICPACFARHFAEIWEEEEEEWRERVTRDWEDLSRICAWCGRGEQRGNPGWRAGVSSCVVSDEGVHISDARLSYHSPSDGRNSPSLSRSHTPRGPRRR